MPELIISGLPLNNPYVGLGIYTKRLIRGLLRHGIGLNFKVVLPSDWLVDEAVVPADHIERLPRFPATGSSFVDYSLLQIRLTHHVCKHHPSAIFHTTAPLTSPLHPAHYLVTIHDTIPDRFPRYLGKYPLRRWLLRASENFSRQADRVLTVSHCSARDLEKFAHIPPSKITVLYNWVDPAFEPESAARRIPEVRERYHLPEKYWLYIGGYDYRKNVEFLLKAFARAKSGREFLPLVLAGEIPTDMRNPYCDVYGTLRETGLTSAEVLMPGKIPEADLPALMKGASWLVYPSLYEGFGYPPAEAMAVGTPVLAADTSSLPEVVRRPECRFDPFQVETLVEKLQLAVKDPAAFACELPEEFTESYAIGCYVEILRQLV